MFPKFEKIFKVGVDFYSSMILNKSSYERMFTEFVNTHPDPYFDDTTMRPERKAALLDEYQGVLNTQASIMMLQFNPERFFMFDGMPIEAEIPKGLKTKDYEVFKRMVRYEIQVILLFYLSHATGSMDEATAMVTAHLKDNVLNDEWLDAHLVDIFKNALQKRKEKAALLIGFRNNAKKKVDAFKDCLGRLSALYGERENAFLSFFMLGKRQKNYWLDIKIRGIIVYGIDQFFLHDSKRFGLLDSKREFLKQLHIRMKRDSSFYRFNEIRKASKKDDSIDYAIAYLHSVYGSGGLGDCTVFHYVLPKFNKLMKLRKLLVE